MTTIFDVEEPDENRQPFNPHARPKFEENKPRQRLYVRLKKWANWRGSWQSYLKYLDDNNALSGNIILQNGEYSLRPGYVPPWSDKDFR